MAVLRAWLYIGEIWRFGTPNGRSEPFPSVLTRWGSVSLIGVAGKASLPVKQPGKPLQPLAKDFAASQTLFDERLHGVVDTFVEGGLGLQCVEECSDS